MTKYLRFCGSVSACLVVLHSVASAEPPTLTAEDIHQRLLSSMPLAKYVADTLAVSPVGDAFDVRFDIVALLRKLAIENVELSGLEPLAAQLKPLPDGTLAYSSDQKLDVSGSFPSMDGGRINFVADWRSLVTNAILPPEMSFFSSSAVTAEGMHVRLTAPQSDIDDRTARLVINTRTDPASTPGRFNLRSEQQAEGWSQWKTEARTQKSLMTSSRTEINTVISDLNLVPLQQFTFSLLDKLYGKQYERPSPAELRTLALKTMPLLSGFRQDASLDKLHVNDASGDFDVERINYTLVAEGLAGDAILSLKLDMLEPELRSALTPPYFSDLMPDTASIDVSLAGLNPAKALEYVIENADYTLQDSFTRIEWPLALKRLVPSGTYTMRFADTHFSSELYDIDVSGSFTYLLDDREKYQAAVTIRSQNFDRLIAYVQANAKDVPEFGQAAFLMLMAKGFAMTESNGANSWTVEATDNGIFRVNGRDFGKSAN